MHGQGVYTWKDGRMYKGQYNMDKKHGYGEYRWADGRVYTGEWAHGKQHGQGEYIMPNGIKRLGRWVEGKRVCWIEQNGDEPQDEVDPTLEQDK